MEILNRSQPSVVSSVLASLEASCVRDQHTDLLLRVWSLYNRAMKSLQFYGISFSLNK